MELNKQPILILAICFILGIFFQDCFSLDKNGILWIGGVYLLFSFPGFFNKYFLFKVRPYLLGVLFFVIGIILHFFNSGYSQDLKISKNENIVFKISRKLNSSVKYRKYEAEVQAGKEHFNAVVYISKEEKELDFKHYYKTHAYISKPKTPQYDFQFDYSKYLKRKNIEYQCFVSDIIVSAEHSESSWSENFSQKRLEVLQNINKTSLSPKSREFLKGIILADRTEIDQQTVQDFSRSGLVHFLAISGTHIVVIFGLFYFIFIKVLPLRFRKEAIISSLVLIWLFTAFIGFGSSVVRSSLMLSIYFIYVLLQRKTDLLHSLSLSALVILVFDTQQIFDVGFQLSFLAVLGIYWLNQPILSYFPRQDNRLKKLLFNTVSISISAQLATLPLVLYYFHQFSFISVFANFFIVPFSEIIIIFSFLMTAFIAFNFNSEWINTVYDLVIQLLLRIIHWFADFDSVFVENIPMNEIEVFFLFIIIYFLRFTVTKFNIKTSTRLIMSFFIFLVVRMGFNSYAQQQQEVLIHDFSGHKFLLVKNGEGVCFWIGKDVDGQKVKQFVVNPYCASRRIGKTEFRRLPDNVQKVVCNGKIYDLN
ncbi:ComEC/Rec2 family competence protein [uncultured Chryseobacterium sp.]|uniref:ComEC/Rec2 family competence protein n=1 Tax=uncultured Chryseobacterium sp. TaxID=259322 RepID=UPI0025D8AC1A|nr:ComEC/Rec2 family competence protein [uncultured Chryseobacterium sp.]